MGYEPTKDGREQGKLVQGLGQQHWLDWSKGEGFAGALPSWKSFLPAVVFAEGGTQRPCSRVSMFAVHTAPAHPPEMKNGSKVRVVESVHGRECNMCAYPG
jgi:hypothetical protein